VPGLRRLLRGAIYVAQEILYGAFRTGSRRNRLVTAMAKAHLRRQVNDPVLRTRLTPAYTLGCKRLLVSSDYLPSFNRANVELVTETIEAVTRHGLRTADGIERAFDALVFATGFDVRNCLRPVDIVGRGGLALQQAWAEGPEAYRGVAAPGFPNMFFLYGPNTNLGHSSIVFMLECQFAYVRRCRKVADRLAEIEVKPEASRAYNADLQARLGRMVWATGCGNWYGQDGRITANWSGSTTAFWRQMRRVRWQDFSLRPARTEGGRSPPSQASHRTMR
jgi:cation diffusion facilitator CzcD-associated flavoprotein CzcO